MAGRLKRNAARPHRAEPPSTALRRSEARSIVKPDARVQPATQRHLRRLHSESVPNRDATIPVFNRIRRRRTYRSPSVHLPHHQAQCERQPRRPRKQRSHHNQVFTVALPRPQTQFRVPKMNIFAAIHHTQACRCHDVPITRRPTRHDKLNLLQIQFCLRHTPPEGHCARQLAHARPAAPHPHKHPLGVVLPTTATLFPGRG